MSMLSLDHHGASVVHGIYILHDTTKTFPPDQKISIQIVPNPFNWSPNSYKWLFVNLAFRITRLLQQQQRQHRPTSRLPQMQWRRQGSGGLGALVRYNHCLTVQLKRPVFQTSETSTCLKLALGGKRVVAGLGFFSLLFVPFCLRLAGELKMKYLTNQFLSCDEVDWQ